MTSFTRFAAAAAAIGCIAAPAAAQYAPYPQTYPQTYPQQAYPGYAQPSYNQNPVGAIIDSLLGNRYNVTDRQAVSQCATAAMAQASAQYGGGYGGGYNGYGNNGYNRGYSNNMRVTAITDVQRRNNGLRVTGRMSSGYGGQGYQNRGYGASELSFRCNVDYRGAVTNIRINRSTNGYRR
jgi:hypothetical protein